MYSIDVFSFLAEYTAQCKTALSIVCLADQVTVLKYFSHNKNLSIAENAGSGKRVADIPDIKIYKNKPLK